MTTVDAPRERDGPAAQAGDNQGDGRGSGRDCDRRPGRPDCDPFHLVMAVRGTADSAVVWKRRRFHLPGRSGRQGCRGPSGRGKSQQPGTASIKTAAPVASASARKAASQDVLSQMQPYRSRSCGAKQAPASYPVWTCVIYRSQMQANFPRKIDLRISTDRADTPRLASQAGNALQCPSWPLKRGGVSNNGGVASLDTCGFRAYDPFEGIETNCDGAYPPGDTTASGLTTRLRVLKQNCASVFGRPGRGSFRAYDPFEGIETIQRPRHAPRRRVQLQGLRPV